jgi:hypothetical protein
MFYTKQAFSKTIYNEFINTDFALLLPTAATTGTADNYR